MFNPQNQKINKKKQVTYHPNFSFMLHFFLVNFSITFQRLTCDIYVENLDESMHVTYDLLIVLVSQTNNLKIDFFYFILMKSHQRCF